jgi:hypothetical protein
VGAFDGFRSLFGIRQDRAPLPAGFKPKPGARIAKGDLRMLVQAGLTDELWNWLQEVGFREVTHRPDRRRYRDLPRPMVIGLYDAPAEEWDVRLKAAIRAATKRPPVSTLARQVRLQR